MAHLEKAFQVDAIPEYFPCAQAYHGNSVVSTIILQSLPLLHILKNTTSALQREFAMLLFLERSSAFDWRLRLDYLQSVMDAFLTNASYQCRDVALTFKSFIQSFGSIFNSELMKDLRNEFKTLRCTRFG